MTINFLDLYNDVASQSWSMFDSGATTKNDFEPALVSSINKAIIDIWYSYPFPFRQKKYEFTTMPRVSKYELPFGNIVNESSIEENLFAVMIDKSYLSNVYNFSDETISACPTEFVIEDDNIVLSPVPDKKYRVLIKYLTLAIGYDSSGNEIFCMENPTDYIDIPAKYESVFKNTVLAKSLVDSIVSVSDENYAGYRLQFEKAYKLLIKVTNPIKKNMSVII